jgi:hypothetical protein
MTAPRVAECRQIDAVFYFFLLPPCFPGLNGKVGEAKVPCRIFRNGLFLLGKNGAGEANRTPDPNLGKVMLYP